MIVSASYREITGARYLQRCAYRSTCAVRKHCPLHPDVRHRDGCKGFPRGARCLLSGKPITGPDHYDADLDDATRLHHFWGDPPAGQLVRYDSKRMCGATLGDVTGMPWRVTCTSCLSQMSEEDFAARAHPPRGERALRAHVSPVDRQVVWAAKEDAPAEPDLPRDPRPARSRRRPVFEQTAAELELEGWFRVLCDGARLRPVRDDDGPLHVVGHWGDVYAHGPGRLAVCVVGPTAYRKNDLKRKHADLLTLQQEGACEAVFTFTPDRLAEVARLVRCRFRRVLTDEQRARLAAGMAAVREHIGRNE